MPYPVLLAVTVARLSTVSLPVEPVVHHRSAHDPWVALGCSTVVSGGGQFYNGDPALGWWLFAPVAAYPLAWGVDTVAGSTTWRLADLVVLLGAQGYSMWEAYHRDLAPSPPAGRS